MRENQDSLIGHIISHRIQMKVIASNTSFSRGNYYTLGSANYSNVLPLSLFHSNFREIPVQQEQLKWYYPLCPHCTKFIKCKTCKSKRKEFRMNRFHASYYLYMLLESTTWLKSTLTTGFSLGYLLKKFSVFTMKAVLISLTNVCGGGVCVHVHACMQALDWGIGIQRD